MKNEIFSEYFARNSNLFTKADARVKIIFTSFAMIIVLLSRSPYIPFIAAFLVVVSLLGVSIPFKIIAARLSATLGIAITLLIIKIFFYHDSLSSGMLIISKIIGSTSLVLFLSMTTTLDKLLAACMCFKVPKTWIEICLIAYRYIFVLLEDAITVFDAQKARLGYTSLARSLRSAGTLAGMVVLRAYDQSISTYEAMMLRGYKG